MHNFKTKITGLMFALLLLLTQAKPVHAIFSPNVQVGVSVIKSHIKESQSKYGNGSMTTVLDRVLEEQKAKQEAGQATGVTGLIEGFRRTVGVHRKEETGKSFWDWISLLFGEWHGIDLRLSDCLRDDLLELEDLKELTVQEAFKTGLLYDTRLFQLLTEDYFYLHQKIIQLKEYYREASHLTGLAGPDHPFYPEGEKDYYVKGVCPYSEFQSAIDDLCQSIDNLGAAARFECPTCDWGNLQKEAERRGKQQGFEWLAKNKISLRVGGEPGSGGYNLLDEGLDQFTGRAKTEFELGKEFIDVVRPLFKLSKYSKEIEAIEADEALRAKREELLKQDCVIFDSELDSPEGAWRDCTEQEKANFEGDAGCDLCVNPNQLGTAFDELQRLQKRVEAKAKEQQKLEKMIVFNLQYSSVAESGLENLSRLLQDIDQEIVNSVEEKNKAIKGLPTLFDNLDKFEQCSNHRPF